MAKTERIGILTGGGDCPGLNAVIRAAVKHAVTELGWQVLGIRDSFNGVLSNPFEVDELVRDSVRGILTKGGTILGTTNRGDPFAFPTRTPDGLEHLDRSDEVVEAMRILKLTGLIVIGGDGTLRIAQKLMEKGIRVIGVPKTIDNDLRATDITFGFNTAVEVATEAIDRLHSTAESHDRVMVVEVMGRDCGWIATHAGIAGGADVILIPEIPYDIARVVDKVRRRQTAGRFFSIVVVAEGAAPAGGGQTFLDGAGTADVARLGGIGAEVGRQIAERCDVETRVTVLGHLLRGGTPSGLDRLLATRFGSHAIKIAAEDRWGEMVAIRGDTITSVPIAEAVSGLKSVAPDGELVETGRSLGIEFGQGPSESP